eukprot:scaffold81146_cov21-Tisochrysis_lutea.AAC.2
MPEGARKATEHNLLAHPHLVFTARYSGMHSTMAFMVQWGARYSGVHTKYIITRTRELLYTVLPHT